jgi:serine/threonine protein kinase
MSAENNAKPLSFVGYDTVDDVKNQSAESTVDDDSVVTLHTLPEGNDHVSSSLETMAPSVSHSNDSGPRASGVDVEDSFDSSCENSAIQAGSSHITLVPAQFTGGQVAAMESFSTSQRASSADSLRPGYRFGQYSIESQIGRGGMGAVFRAVNTKLNKAVALKILPSDFLTNLEAVQRFEREMRSLGSVDHPNVIRALDAGEIDGIHYLAMEFVQGVDLDHFIRKTGPCKPELACRFLSQAATGLHVAHLAGLVHRDIKPANIMVTIDGIAKVADLGLARIQGQDQGTSADEMTQRHQIMGTPDYMSPEQWEDTARADARSDLYSLGCVLYFMLSGRAPYASQGNSTVGQKMKAHITQPPPSLETLHDDLPDALSNLYSDLMQKDPALRPQSALEVANAFQRIYPNYDSRPNIQSLLSSQASNSQSDASNAYATTKLLPVPNYVTSNRAWLVVAATSALVIAGFVTAKLLTPVSPKQTIQPISTSLAVEVLQRRSDSEVFRQGLIGPQLSAAYYGDLVRLGIDFPSPRYCFVIALNPTDQPEWRVQLVYPSKNDLRPVKSDKLSLPEKPTSYLPLTDGVGQQAYLVIESEKPLPAFSDWQKTVATDEWDKPWKAGQYPGIWKFSDGELSLYIAEDEPNRMSSERAAVIDIAPPALDGLLAKLNTKIADHKERITALAFPVQAK